MAIGAYVKRVAAGLFPGRIIYSGDSRERCVALTFDDGPHPTNTVRLLETLDSRGVSATFFVQGTAAEKNPELLRRVAESGHCVGNHGYSHSKPSRQTASELVDEVLRTESLIVDATGREPAKIFRPPYGGTNLGGFFGLWRRGYAIAYWSLDLSDSFADDAGELVSALKNSNVRCGDIALFHDDRDSTVVALAEMIDYLAGTGFSFRTVEQMLEGR